LKRTRGPDFSLTPESGSKANAGPAIPRDRATTQASTRPDLKLDICITLFFFRPARKPAHGIVPWLLDPFYTGGDATVCIQAPDRRATGQQSFIEGSGVHYVLNGIDRQTNHSPVPSGSQCSGFVAANGRCRPGAVLADLSEKSVAKRPQTAYLSGLHIKCEQPNARQEGSSRNSRHLVEFYCASSTCRSAAANFRR